MGAAMTREMEVPAAVRATAQRLTGLFLRDQELTRALNDAHQQLLDANDRLTAGLSAEALRGIYGPAGPDLALSGDPPPVLREEFPVAALERVAGAIRVAHDEYQRVADDRCVLAFEIGEAAAELTAALTAAGFSEEEARAADVHALATGIFRAGGTGGGSG